MMDHGLYLAGLLSEKIQNRYGGTLVLNYGWAADALTGGAATRVHHDVDADFILPQGVAPQEVFKYSLDIYNNHSPLSWTREGNYPTWSALRAGVRPGQPLSGLRLDCHALYRDRPISDNGEVSIVSSNGKSYKLEIQNAYLTDSKRNTYRVAVPTPEYLIANKIQLIHSMKGLGKNGDTDHRVFGPTDVYDLRRLFQLPGLNTSKVNGLVRSYLTTARGMSPAQAQAEMVQLVGACREYSGEGATPSSWQQPDRADRAMPSHL